MTSKEYKAADDMLTAIVKQTNDGEKWARIYLSRLWDEDLDRQIVFDVRPDFFTYHYPKIDEGNVDEEEPAYEFTPRGVEFSDYNNEFRISGRDIAKFEVLPDDAEPMYPPWELARTQAKNMVNGKMLPLEPEPETWK